MKASFISTMWDKLRNIFVKSESGREYQEISQNVESEKEKVARKIISFLRRREHEFQYGLMSYPDVTPWSTGKWKDIKRQLGGHSHQVLNCSGLVFYTHFRTGILSKDHLEARAEAMNALVRSYPVNNMTSGVLQELCQDLTGGTTALPIGDVDFMTIQPGSTVVFKVGDRPISHVAIMLDGGQMAHLIQTVTVPEALERPDIAAGHLEITTSDKVVALVEHMRFGNDVINVIYTDGPKNFVAENLVRRNETTNNEDVVATSSNTSVTPNPNRLKHTDPSLQVKNKRTSSSRNKDSSSISPLPVTGKEKRKSRH